MRDFVPTALQRFDEARETVLDSGFSEEALALADAVMVHWRSWLKEGAAPEWPRNEQARRLLGSMISVRDNGEAAVAGRLTVPGREEAGRLAAGAPEGVHLAGGRLLASALDRNLRALFGWIALVFAAVTGGLLLIALRSPALVLLALGSLALGNAALLGMMGWLGLAWNMFTLPAILLSLGTGSDYAIHVLLRLKQRADSRTMREHLTAPLLVCAGGSVLGFASLTTAASAGLAQMGLVCSLAIGLNAIAAVVVMPRVWVWLTFRRV